MVLVVSELATNALRHCGGACTLGLSAHPDAIEVAVHYRSPRTPRMRTPDRDMSAAGGKTVSALMTR